MIPRRPCQCYLTLTPGAGTYKEGAGPALSAPSRHTRTCAPGSALSALYFILFCVYFFCAWYFTRDVPCSTNSCKQQTRAPPGTFASRGARLGAGRGLPLGCLSSGPRVSGAAHCPGLKAQCLKEEQQRFDEPGRSAWGRLQCGGVTP